MVKRINGIWRQLAAAILGLLGFASCSKDIVGGEGGDIMVMYGQPHADFKVIGSVKDKQGKPIEGIRVAITRHNYYPNSTGVFLDRNHWYYYDTLYTDSKGEFLRDETVSDQPDDVVIVFEDVDGEEHGGLFETVKTTPSVTRTKKEEGFWYRGAFEVKSNVKMKKK